MLDTLGIFNVELIQASGSFQGYRPIRYVGKFLSTG
jgi:hypothetical protein